MVLRVTANRHDVNRRVLQHLVEAGMALDGATVAGTDLGGIQRTRGADGRHLGMRRGVDGRNVGRADPPVSDDADVIAFCTHALGKWITGKMAMVSVGKVKGKHLFAGKPV